MPESSPTTRPLWLPLDGAVVVSRRGGRPVWLPALLLWLPTLLGGLYVLAGVDFNSTDVGRGEYSVQVSLEAPASWYDPVWRGVVGTLLSLAGLVLYGAFQWRPTLNRPMVVTHFAIYAAAGLCFLAFAVLGTWSLTGHVVDGGASGLVWRFIAAERTGVVNVATYVAGYAAALGLFAMSFGSRRHLLPPPPRATVIPGDPGDDGVGVTLQDG